MWSFIVRIILRNRIAILIILGLITAYMGYNAYHLQLSYEFAKVLPRKDSTNIQYQNFRDLFGEDGNILIIGIDDSTITDLDNYTEWYDLSKSIKRIKGVDTVLSISNIYSLKNIDSTDQLVLNQVVKSKPSSQKELDSLLEIVYSLSFYKNIVFSDTSDFTAIAVTVNKNVLNTKTRKTFINQITETVSGFSENTGIEAHVSGLPYIRTKTTQKLAGELKLFTLLAALILAVILYLFFNSFRVVLVSLLIVSVAVVWVMGTTHLFGFKITMLSGLIPPLIIVIGIPNCIFLLNKYHQEYSSHGNKVKALSRVVEKIGNATLMTNATTASGFATFIFTSSAILREFGIIAALNIMCVFLISLLIIPIVFSFMKPPLHRHLKHLDNKGLRTIIFRLVDSVFHYRTTIYIVTAIILVLGIFGISLMKTTGNIVDDLPQKDPVYVDLMFFEKNMKGVMPFEIQIDTKEKNGVFKNDARTLSKIKRLTRTIERDSLLSGYFSRSISVNDAVSFAYQAYKGGDSKYYLVPPPNKLVKLKKYIKNNENGNQEYKSFIDTSNQITRVSLQMANVSTNQIQQLTDTLNTIISKIFPVPDYEVILTGTSVVFLKGTNYLVKNLFVALGLAVILISIFMALMFNSARMVGVALIPNIIPLICTAALMGYFGISIKPSTILVFSIAFGISVDNTIHFLAKYRQELKIRHAGIKQSVLNALKEAGVSMIYTSVVLFFGFGIFALSGFGGTTALGILTSITLLVAVLSNLLLLPALLMSLEKRAITKAFKESGLGILNKEDEISKDAFKYKNIEE